MGECCECHDCGCFGSDRNFRGRRSLQLDKWQVVDVPGNRSSRRCGRVDTNSIELSY